MASRSDSDSLSSPPSPVFKDKRRKFKKKTKKMRKENESDQQDEAAASLPPDVEIKQEVMDEEDVVHVPSDDDVKPDAQDILLQENRKLQQKVKRLNVKLQQAKKEAEERIALSRLSRERLIDIIIDAKYHGGDL